MKLRIENIADRGVPNEERLHLRVIEPTNLGSHLVMSSAWVAPTAVANGSKPVFWFPPQDVRPGDEVILYTRGGIFEQRPQTLLGPTTYFYFWGLSNTLWNNDSSCALIFDVASWAASSNLNPLGLMAQLASGVQVHPEPKSFGEAIASAQAAHSPLTEAIMRYEANRKHNMLAPEDDEDDSNSHNPLIPY
jgi:hypothetical protein